MQERAQQVLAEVFEAGDEVAHRQPPAPAVGTHARGGLLDRLIEHARTAVVQWMPAVDLSPFPGQPVAAQIDLRQNGEPTPSG